MKYDIDALKRSVLALYPFFGGVAAKITYEETEEIGTTGNAGSILFYNPVYLSGLSPAEQVFALAHELCHIAFGHAGRGRGRDPEIWKTATDAVINQMLKRDGLTIAAGGVDYPEAVDYDAEQYYELLLQEKLAIELIGGRIDEKERSVSRMDPDDRQQEEDGFTDDALSDDSMMTEGEDSPYEEAAGRPQEDDEEKKDGMELFRALMEELQEPAEDFGPPEQKRQDDRDLSEENAALSARLVSDAGNSISRDVRAVPEIGASLPVIDWRTVLRDTLHHDVDWSFANAVLEDGVVRPVLEEQTMPETEIVLDTSWSVDEELLRSFLRECKNILLRSKLRAGCFDTVFYGFHEILTEEDIDGMVFEGGGGTDFNAAAGAFTLRADNRIIFTDGKAPMPEAAPEAIWMVYGDERIEPENGTVIHIKPGQWV